MTAMIFMDGLNTKSMAMPNYDDNAPPKRTKRRTPICVRWCWGTALVMASLSEAARLRIAASLTSGPWMKSGCW
jgi:hypothetical protein